MGKINFGSIERLKLERLCHRCCLLTILFIEILIVLGASPAFSAPPPSGDWIVSSTESYTDQTITLNGNLIIEGGGSLTLTHVTLMINSPSDGAYGIDVRSGGTLKIYDTDNDPATTNDASTITSYVEDGNHRFSFKVNAGSIFEFKNSFLRQCGTSLSSSLFVSTNNAIIQGNTITTCYIGIVTYQVSGTKIDSNTINSNLEHGIESIDSDDEITSNTATNNGGVGIYVYGGSHHARTTITSNTVQGNTGDGVLLNSVSSDTSTITGNTITDNGINGIGLIGSHPSISGNTISNNGDISGNGNGIVCSSSSAPTITDNTIHSNTINGIFCAEGSNSFISQNTIYGNNWDGVGSSSSSPTVTLNIIYNNGVDGVSFDVGSGGLIDGNTVYSNTWSGIECNANSNPIISNNIVYLNGNEGIVCTDNSSPEIINNESYENAVNGVYLVDSPSAYLYNNYIHDNLLDGIGVVRSSPTIINNRVNGNKHGIVAYYSSFEVKDSTVINNIDWDFVLNYGSTITVTNTTYDPEKVWLIDSSSKFIVNENPASAYFLVVRGADERVYYNQRSGDVWGGWHVIPSGWTIDGPASAVSGDTLHLVVRGSSNSIWHGSVDLTTEGFSGWVRIPGETPSRPSLAAADDGKLYLVVRGMNNEVWLNVRDQGGSWNGWLRLPGAIYEGPSATIDSNILHIAVQGSSQTIYHGRMDTTINTWLGYTRLAGSTFSSLAISSTSVDGLYLVVRGTTNQIYWTYYDSGSWRDWDVVLGGLTDDGPGATLANGELHVAVKGASTTAIYTNEMDLASTSWSGWTYTAGDTSSEPQLCS